MIVSIGSQWWILFIHITILVLSRVQAFLPQLQTANKELDNKDPSELDIENVDEEQDGQYIEMVR